MLGSSGRDDGISGRWIPKVVAGLLEAKDDNNVPSFEIIRKVFWVG